MESYIGILGNNFVMIYINFQSCFIHIDFLLEESMKPWGSLTLFKLYRYDRVVSMKRRREERHGTGLAI